MSFKLLILLIILFFTSEVVSTKSRNSYREGVRFAAVSCKADNISLSYTLCNLKAYSASAVAINIGFRLHRTFNKPIYFQLIVFYRYGIVFHQVIDTKKIEWCGFMDGTVVNKFFLGIFDSLKDVLSGFLHKCPYKPGDIELKNFTLEDSFTANYLNIFPDGFYKMWTIIYDSNENIIGNSNITAQFKSHVKETFG